MSISRKQLLQIPRKTEDVPVNHPDLTGAIKVGALMFGGHSRYKDALVGFNADGELGMLNQLHYADVVLLHECLLENDGSQMFGPNEIHLAAAIPEPIALELIPVIKRLSGLTKVAEQTLGKEQETQTPSTPTS